MNQSSRRVAVVGGVRIPFCRSNTLYADLSNLDMMTATLNGLSAKYNLSGAHIDEVVGGAVQVAHQGRQALGDLGQVLGGVAQPRFGPAVFEHPLLDQGLRQGPDVELRHQPAADALGHDHVLLQQQELRLHLQGEALAEAETRVMKSIARTVRGI